MTNLTDSPQPALRIAVVPVTAFQQNCSLVWDLATKRGAIIDPGGEIDGLLALCAREGVTLEKILLTHAHVDHAAATAELARRTGVPIEGPHRDDRFLIDSLAEQSSAYDIPSEGAFEPDRWLSDGDRVTVGNLEFQVIHCPGHTPGHVVYYHAPSHFAVVGDVLFQGSIGRTDFPRGNHADLIASIRDKLFTLGDEVQFLPGHGPLSTFGDERRTNPFVSDAAVARR